MNTLTEKDWGTLLGTIEDGECTPFLGAGINDGILPKGADIATRWAKEHNYPLEDCADLARVAQFLAVDRGDGIFPKREIRKLFRNVAMPNFHAPNDPHGVLAELPLSIYLTTNYDNLMVGALKSRRREPHRELCRWNNALKNCPSIFDSPSGSEPTPANPVVFHLHGHVDEIDSMVLTEDDYLDFLVNISTNRNDRKLIPARIEKAMSRASLLFIGYRLSDWSFRVLFRGLVCSLEGSLRRANVAVQLLPDVAQPVSAQAYLNKYFGDMKIRVYWGTAKEFALELRERWRKFKQ